MFTCMCIFFILIFMTQQTLVVLDFATSIQRNVAIIVATDWRRALSIHVKYTVQTISFRLWYDPILGVSNLGIYDLGTLFHIDLPFLLYMISHGIDPHPPHPRKYSWNISRHCSINDWINYIKIFDVWIKLIVIIFKQQFMQYDIAEFYVYSVLKL